MERLRQRLTLAARALESLEELSGIESPGAVERDAAIQRFEYTFEAVWKAVQRFLSVMEGSQAGSPKACVRLARDAGLLGDEETERALAMVDDRNLTVHTYNEGLARAIFGRLSGHAGLLRRWMEATAARLPDGPAI